MQRVSLHSTALKKQQRLSEESDIYAVEKITLHGRPKL